jgi:hypothetical protein
MLDRLGDLLLCTAQGFASAFLEPVWPEGAKRPVPLKNYLEGFALVLCCPNPVVLYPVQFDHALILQTDNATGSKRAHVGTLFLTQFDAIWRNQAGQKFTAVIHSDQ